MVTLLQTMLKHHLRMAQWGKKIHLGWIYISILAAEEAETAPDFANSLVFLALRARSCAREQR